MVTNGMSHATHSTGPAPDTMAVWIPPRLPLPGRTSGMVRRSGRQVGPSGALAMSTGGSSDAVRDRKSTRLNSSHGYISYAVFCLKKKTELAHRHAVRLCRLDPQ